MFTRTDLLAFVRAQARWFDDSTFHRRGSVFHVPIGSGMVTLAGPAVRQVWNDARRIARKSKQRKATR